MSMMAGWRPSISDETVVVLVREYRRLTVRETVPDVSKTTIDKKIWDTIWSVADGYPRMLSDEHKRKRAVS